MQTPMRPRAALILLPLLLVMAGVLAACDSQSRSAGQQAKPSPPAVQVQTVQPRTVALNRAYVGRTSGAKEVEVRARVQGILLARRYEEGAMVEQGETLFQIDPERFEIQVQRAQGELARAQAALQQARRQWQRIEALFDDGAVSATQRDEALATLEFARADVTLAEAGLADAQLDLDHASVEAPVSGVTSLAVPSEGDLVQPQMLLTTVTQFDPIHVQFSIPEEDAIAQRRRLAAAGSGVADKPVRIEAELLLPDGTTFERVGVVDFTETGIDPQTGTMRARAVFPNPEGRLLPGIFVRVALKGLTLANAIVVPDKAVTEGAEGPMVYTLNTDNRAQSTPVTLGPRVSGGTVIARGLKGGERVVVSGIASVRPGQPVKPMGRPDGKTGDDAVAMNGDRGDAR